MANPDKADPWLEALTKLEDEAAYEKQPTAWAEARRRADELWKQRKYIERLMRF